MKYGKQGMFDRARSRLVRLGIAAMVVLGSFALTTVPASAAKACSGARDANVCLEINLRPDGNYDVHVGIDVHMSFDEAQEYVDDVGDPFVVWIRGDDSGKLAEFLFRVPMTSLGADPSGILGADFDTVVPGRFLDEDRNDRDEVRAEVTLIDTDTNTVTGRFLSPRIDGNWF